MFKAMSGQSLPWLAMAGYGRTRPAMAGPGLMKISMNHIIRLEILVRVRDDGNAPRPLKWVETKGSDSTKNQQKNMLKSISEKY